MQNMVKDNENILIFALIKPFDLHNSDNNSYF